jgi:hypothetical protein
LPMAVLTYGARKAHKWHPTGGTMRKTKKKVIK